jgi:hypothetical protein
MITIPDPLEEITPNAPHVGSSDLAMMTSASARLVGRKRWHLK